MKSSLQISDSLNVAAANAIRMASAALLQRQSAEGYWNAALRADSTLESDYIMLQLWLHPPVNGVWNPPTRPRIDRAVSAILARQLPDGGFNIYLHGPSEINACIKAYFALKLAGVPVSDPRMQRLGSRICEMGGLQAANSYVRTNLNLFNLYPRDACPSRCPRGVTCPCLRTRVRPTRRGPATPCGR